MEQAHTWLVAVARTTRMRGKSQLPSTLNVSLAFATFPAAPFPRGPNGMWARMFVYSTVYNNKSLQTAQSSQKGSGKIISKQ